MEDVEYLEEYEDVVLTTSRSKGKLISYNTVSPPIAFNSLYCEDSNFGFAEHSVIEDAAPFQMKYDNTDDSTIEGDDHDDSTIEGDLDYSTIEGDDLDDSTIEGESLDLDSSDLSYKDLQPYLSNDEVSTNFESSQDFNNSITEHSHKSPEKRQAEKKKPKKRRIRNLDAVSSDEEVETVRRKIETSKQKKTVNAKEDKSSSKPASSPVLKKWIKNKIKSNPKIEPIKKSIRKKTPTPHMEKFMKTNQGRSFKNTMSAKYDTQAPSSQNIGNKNTMSAKYATQSPSSQNIRKPLNTSVSSGIKNKAIGKPIKGIKKEVPEALPSIVRKFFKSSLSGSFKNMNIKKEIAANPDDDSDIITERTSKPDVGFSSKTKITSRQGTGSPKDVSEGFENTFKPIVGRGLKNKVTSTPAIQSPKFTFKPIVGRGLKNQVSSTPANENVKDAAKTLSGIFNNKPVKGRAVNTSQSPQNVQNNTSEIPQNISKSVLGRGSQKKISNTPLEKQSPKDSLEISAKTSKQSPDHGLKYKMTSTPVAGSPKDALEISEKTSKQSLDHGMKYKMTSTPVAAGPISEISENISQNVLAYSRKFQIMSTPLGRKSPKDISEISENTPKPVRGLKNKLTPTSTVGSSKDNLDIFEKNSKSAQIRGLKNKLTTTLPMGSPNDTRTPQKTESPNDLLETPKNISDESTLGDVLAVTESSTDVSGISKSITKPRRLVKKKQIFSPAIHISKRTIKSALDMENAIVRAPVTVNQDGSSKSDLSFMQKCLKRSKNKLTRTPVTAKNVPGVKTSMHANDLPVISDPKSITSQAENSSNLSMKEKQSTSTQKTNPEEQSIAAEELLNTMDQINNEDILQESKPGIIVKNSPKENSETIQVPLKAKEVLKEQLTSLPSVTIQSETIEDVSKREENLNPSALQKRQSKKLPRIIKAGMKRGDDMNVQKIKLRKVKVRLKKYEIRDILSVCKGPHIKNTTIKKICVPGLMEKNETDQDKKEESLLSPIKSKRIQRRLLLEYSAKSKKAQKLIKTDNLKLEHNPESNVKQNTSKLVASVANAAAPAPVAATAGKSNLCLRKATPNQNIRVTSYQLGPEEKKLMSINPDLIVTRKLLPQKHYTGSKRIPKDMNNISEKVECTSQLGALTTENVPLQKEVLNNTEMMLSNIGQLNAPIINLLHVPCHLVVETKLLTRKEYMRRNLSKTKLIAATGSGSEDNIVSSDTKPMVSIPNNTDIIQNSNTSMAVSGESLNSVTAAVTCVSSSNTKTTPKQTTSVLEGDVLRAERTGINNVFEKIHNLIDEEVSREVTRKLQEISEGFSVGELTKGKRRRKKIKWDCDLRTASYIYEFLKEYLTADSNGNVETTSNTTTTTTTTSTTTLTPTEMLKSEDSILPDLDRTEESIKPGPSKRRAAYTSTPMSNIQIRAASKKSLVPASSNMRQLINVVNMKRKTNITRSTINKNRRNKSPEYFRFRKIRLPSTQALQVDDDKEDTITNVAQDHTYSTSPPMPVTSTSMSPQETSVQPPSTNISVSTQQNTTPSSYNTTPMKTVPKNVKNSVFLEPRMIQSKTVESQHLPFTRLMASEPNINRLDNRSELIIPDDPDDCGEIGEDETSGSKNTEEIDENSMIDPKLLNMPTAKPSENLNSNSDYKVVISRTLKKFYIPKDSTMLNPSDGFVLSDVILPDEPDITEEATSTTTKTKIVAAAASTSAKASNDDSRSGVFIIGGGAKEGADSTTVDPLYTEEYSLDTGYQFKCKKCTVILSSRPLIQDHIQRTHFKACKKCYLCGVIFDQIYFVQHFLDFHSSTLISR